MRKDIMIMMVFLLVCSFSLVGCEQTPDKKANDKKEKVNGVQGGDPKKLHGIFDDIDMEDIGKKIKK